MATWTIDKVHMKVTPLNPRWEGYGAITPVCKCGSNMAQRFDDKPWRCHRGHFTKSVRWVTDTKP